MSRPGARRWRHDVVFYLPGVTARLSGSATSGGAETQVMLLATSLARAGYRVAVVAYQDSDALPATVDGVSVIPRPKRRTALPVISKVVELFFVWQSLWRARAPTVVTRCAGIQVGLVALFCRLARRHMVFASANVIDFDYGRIIRGRRNRLLYRVGITLADALVVQTEEQVELCQRAFGRNPVLIKSVAAPADPQRDEPRAFVWIGRLADYKRPGEYVALARAVPEARFWMVAAPADGEAGAALDIERAAASTPNLTLLPPRSREGIGELFDRAVASVNTADFEGMPNVFLEAWSRGVPALSLTHDPGGVITQNGLGGFAEGSREEFARLARGLWSTRQDRAELSERCRSYVARQHSPDHVTAQWCGVLRLGPPTRGQATSSEVLTCAA